MIEALDEVLLWASRAGHSCERGGWSLGRAGLGRDAWGAHRSFSVRLSRQPLVLAEGKRLARTTARPAHTPRCELGFTFESGQDRAAESVDEDRAISIRVEERIQALNLKLDEVRTESGRLKDPACA